MGKVRTHFSKYWCRFTYQYHRNYVRILALMRLFLHGEAIRKVGQKISIMRHSYTLIRRAILAVFLLLGGVLLAPQTAVFSSPTPDEIDTTLEQEAPSVLSPIWSPTIQQWSEDIEILADVYGIHPDLIAAVIREESNGFPEGLSTEGAVGLMGVMPSGPGLEWRPSSEQLLQPSINLRWGVQILAEVVRQSGGDLSAALAAYNGGWEQVDTKVPKAYAEAVLDNYGRAIAARNGVSPDIAGQWTVAIELTRGNVTNSPILVLGAEPVSGTWMYGEHVIYDYVDQSGRAYHIRGYAVPVTLIVPLSEVLETTDELTDNFDAYYQGLPTSSSVSEKEANRNPRIILACLPSLNRLRGHASTRWFAPTDCPDWHR